jgi:hypothetical protein
MLVTSEARMKMVAQEVVVGGLESGDAMAKRDAAPRRRGPAATVPLPRLSMASLDLLLLEATMRARLGEIL